ncbi:GNAT family N-acetyltransferase [Sphingobacterium paludis]|uniref:Acetyltransferase (GNAT) family protein n=1 Tax=Sphingobacterium paludis TaxID=1476465 RepID=A0A4R7CZL4_9SPHI|nr:GNAT family N-acetyltransferase [Sphingobacterium paludis]TDS13211.1 acetyltransferase (GNAT) family protein [Sphingobacterium paludis]
MTLKVLEKKHNRKGFSCGVVELDNYIKQYVSQDVKRKLAVCYILGDEDANVVAYYTLSSSRVDLNDIPDDLKGSLTYTEIPVVIIGRLAVHVDYQGNKLGQILLIDALKRIIEISALVGNHAVIVDPINESAEKFYAKFGFVELKDSKRMFLPLKTIATLFETE